jgi:SAM-dependent methyltransferase
VKREDWNRRYAEIESLWSAAPNRCLVAETAELIQGRALDLACGDGRNAIWLAGLGWHVTGVDFSDVAIAKGRQRAAREGVEVDFRSQDLLDFEPDARAYELVLVLYLQLPADERRVVLGRASEAVATAGTFLLVGHDVLNLTEGVGGPSDPRVLYTPEDIVSELSGLEVQKAERVLRPVEDADHPAIDALVRARRPGG